MYKSRLRFRSDTSEETMDYINAASISESDPGGAAELSVWDSLRQCFDSSEEGILYHQYPIIEKGGNQFDRKPDFVLLHQEYGLVILECKGYRIDQIEEISGDTWTLQVMTQRTATPLEQARDQGYHLISFLRRERGLRNDRGKCVVPMTPVVVLPNIEREDWNQRGFNGPSAPRVITGDELGEVTLRDRLDSVLPQSHLSQNEYHTAKGVLSCGQAISSSSGDPTDNPQTRSEYYEQITKGIHGLDKKQQHIGLKTPPGPQQIRGIAGSGKTVLIAMKAARMLSEPSEWSDGDPEDIQLALTFSTKSLYETLTGLVERFYRQFSGESFETADATLDIIHGWGGAKTGNGIYYQLSKRMSDVQFKRFSDAQEKYPDADDKQEPVAKEVLEAGEVPQLWDAILVDEAQDFGPNFLNMCREALTDENRLIWAYDEAQDLTSLSAPSPTNIFGTDEDGDPLLDLSGQYSGGPQKTYIMRKSYRAPRSLLMLAHTVGMGLKRTEGPIQAITRQEGWENLGYEVDADFRKIGSTAILKRPVDNSPHPIQGELTASDLITHNSFESKLDELNWVSEHILTDIEEEDLDPENILVIPLSRTPRENMKNRDYIADKLRTQLEPHNITINAVWENRNKKFGREGEVTLSAINRAKGNEAASVYVLGVDSVTGEQWRDEEVHRRNQLFVALTRSRAWVSMSGVNPADSIHDEISSVLTEINSSPPQVTFEVPNSRELDNELEKDTETLENANLDDF